MMGFFARRSLRRKHRVMLEKTIYDGWSPTEERSRRMAAILDYVIAGWWAIGLVLIALVAANQL